MLKNRVRADLKVYMGSVAGLDRDIGKDFEAVHQRAQRAKLAFESAREQFNEHIALHG